ncbi:MAG: hypothetical protein A2W05_07355 [Candidatus Schekmanbacteria bacterium RBG_16_38_10]|uniref:Acriflavin resistance protein n=1 Tax=Candidatus Schekmanbacteria bacterium RBG_16_38_10 TaxID=1817879 RepID=A0A1F7RMH6_9BACT|nr:MAG: hypothetical protein A2W05_07355 [Candidatus Schekmanbacteria bacterium RBG_16_38_10]
MYISDLSIDRPVFATMVICALMILGAISLLFIGVELTPEVNPPFVTIMTVYPGAGPEEMETLVTKPIEEGVSSVNGLKKITSSSTEGRSVVNLEFEFEVPIRLAAIEVKEKVSTIRNNLPKDIDEPIIQRFDPSARPILWYGISADIPADEIRRIAENDIKPALEQIDGVAEVGIVGGLEREIQVNLDMQKMVSYNIPMTKVLNIIGNENMNIPAGRIDLEREEMMVRTKGEFNSIDQINNLVVTVNSGVPVYLKDIAEVKDGFKDVREISKINGINSVSFSVKKQSGANTVAVADKIKKALITLKKNLHQDMKIIAIDDQSVDVKMDLTNVREAIVLGVIMAVLIVFLFMRDWRSTVICALALPTSLISTFFFMYIMGFTLNIMTLMALSLIVGVLIDDSIVVRENIFRHMEEGMEPKKAASIGTKEIGLAVMATTFTIIAVFVPIAFMSGMIGMWFKSFGLTAAFAVMVSLFVSFTLDPMLSAYFMRPIKHEKRKENWFTGFSDRLEEFYKKIDSNYRAVLQWALSHKKFVVIGAIIVFILSMSLISLIGVEFFSMEDRSQMMIDIEMPPGSSINMTDKVASKVESILKKHPDIKTVFTTIGTDGDVTLAQLNVKTTPKGYRKTRKSIGEIISDAREMLKKVPGANIIINQRGMEAAHEAPVNLYIRGDDIDTLSRLSDKIMPIVKKVPGTVDVTSSLKKGKPEIQVIVDRLRAADVGIGIGQVASTLRTMISGQVASKFRDGDKEYDIRVRLKEENRNYPVIIENVSLSSSGGNQVMLKDVSKFNPDLGPMEIRRENRERQVVIASRLKNAALNDVVKNIKDKLKNYKLPRGYTMGFTGQAERMQEAFGTMTKALFLAVIFIYMVLASQFNSFVHPFTIMLSLPLAIVGALMTIFLVGLRFNMSVMFAIIMLLGLVTKNAILLVDYTNTLRSRGINKTDAILTAGPTRLRPILMTTAAMILGMLPVALSRAPGSEFRAPMAISIIGGLIASTGLTLVVVPVVYYLLDEATQKLKKKFIPNRS